MFLGIDLGTSALKIVITNTQSDVLAQSEAPLTVDRTYPLWSEQEPLAWLKAMELCLDTLHKQHPNMLSKVQSIGLSGQMHGATLLDGDHNVLRPAILWNDGRNALECEELEKAVPQSRQIAGNIAMPGFTAPKLLWVKKHEPAIFAQIKHVLLPKDYLRLHLSGEFASDMSDSAGTLWMNVAKRSWSQDMLEACELTVDHMPTLYEGPQQTGKLRKALAEKWGMNEVPIVGGGGDNAAGAIGSGVVQAGDAFLSLGTSGVYFLANARYAPNPADAVHTFCHCLPNTWHQMTVSLSAASCLDWLAALTGVKSVAILLKELEERIGNGEVLTNNVPIFLPYLSGERTPHNNPNAKGAFFGMTHSTERAHLTQAVLEGVAYAFADGQKALLATGETIGQVSVIGGGSRSKLWGSILATTLNKTLSFHEGSEVGPALGAARLAQLGESGDYSNANIQKICFKTPVKFEIEPIATLSSHFLDRWDRYRKLYTQCSEFM